ncbi:hypothetical protein P8452_59025 [Trifolium repens]|nr:hypothetical protein P8452_43346 [Trifolium repens]WJX75496.1 hypothetical protein P8452_59025 [Trifolium repens]
MVCCNNDRKEAGKVAMMIWILWNNINNWVWNHEKEQGHHLGIKAMNLWHEWNAVQLEYGRSRYEQQ